MTAWKCPDCPMTVHGNPDDPQSEAWLAQVRAEHESIHAEQLLEHDGDREALQRRLRNPSLHVAVTSEDQEQP